MNFKSLPRQDSSFITVAWEAWLDARMHWWEAQGSTHDLTWGSNTMGSEHSFEGGVEGASLDVMGNSGLLYW